jgi:hypothetical protein
MKVSQRLSMSTFYLLFMEVICNLVPYIIHVEVIHACQHSIP